MATKKDFVIKNGLVVTEDIELGHASDTTIARASAGQITVEGTAVVLAGSASHDGFSDFVANEHIDHSGVSILGGDGLTGGGAITSNRTLAVGAGTGITVNSSDVAVTAAQTGITSLLNASLAVGRDADNQIKFSTDNQMIFRVGAGDGVTFKASGEIEATKFDGALEGNADTATALATARAINGVDFDGTSPITITAAGSTLSDTVTVAKGGTGQTSYTDGQLLIGNTTGNTLAKATLTAGSGISVTNGAGSITIAATGGGGASALDDLSDAVTTATENVGIGENALDAISSGSGNHNTAIGFDALTDVSTGDYNVGVGLDAGKSVITGSQNTFLGSLAGGNIGNVSGNVIIGYQAGYSAQSSSNSIAIGYDVGKFGLKSASNNIAIGYQAMLGSFANSTGANNNIGIGYHSMHDITTGDDNITIGYQAGELITTGSDNIAIGYEALDAATTENDNIAIGYQAMSGAISGAEKNVVMGNFAGDAITTGDENTLVGHQSGTTLTTAKYSVAVGYRSLYNTDTGDRNTAVGYLSMEGAANNSADQNAAFGGYSLKNVQDGATGNTGLGYLSLSAVTTGDKNIALGYESGDNITTGSNNVVIGAADVSSATGSSQLSISSGDGGVTWITGTSAGHVSLGNFTFNADQTVGSGQDNYVLTYDNSAGTISLEAASGGSTSPAGSDSQIQYNNGGSFGGDADFTWDDSNNRLVIGSVTSQHDSLSKLTVKGTDAGFLLEKHDDSASGGPTMSLYRYSASEADGDLIGQINFRGEGSTGNPSTYMAIRTEIVDTTEGSKDGQLIFRGLQGNSQTEFMTVGTNGVRNMIGSVVAVSSNTTLTDDQSGSYVYWTGGTLTLPATAIKGQQYTIINNTNGSATPALGTSNSIATNWTSHAAMSDETARTYVAVAANTWIYVG